MKIFIFILFATGLFFGFSQKPIKAIENDIYVIENFSSVSEIQKDTSLIITETIDINFPYPKHGIYRIIPVFYSNKGKTINARLEILSVNDEKGNKLKYEKRRLAQSLELKIGDPDKTLEGRQIYKIKYKVDGIIQDYNTHYEVYWNVTGHEWDTDILESNFLLNSPYADIDDAECFAGLFGSDSRLCQIDFSDDNLLSKTTSNTKVGDDFSVVVSLSRENNLVFPSGFQKTRNLIADNWGYFASLIPLTIMFLIWNKKGRDYRYISESIYFEPDDKTRRTVKLFERPHIPFVYHPISKVTPGEAGTIIDEKVHISDIVSEILELARLGFISIRKIETKKLLRKHTDYAFIKLNKFNNDEERKKLKDYQDYLLKELFRSTIIHKSIKNAEDLFKVDNEKLNEARKLLIDKNYVLLSGVKNHFFEGLPVFKDKLYQRMEDEDIFDENPEKTRGKWAGIFIAFNFFAGALVFGYAGITANYFPLITQSLFFVPGIFFALAMPRRTPKGYSLYRQISGLRWYLGKGKWRHQIAEKNLFIEEILPLAVALGVVDRITKDMSDLGIKPPSYFSGSTLGSFSRDIASFNAASASNLISTPQGKSSGASSWSGGSGFSGGGSSGGGFGGGGGGSW